MTDITKCTGQRGDIVCPLRQTCYRFTAKSSPHWQSYFAAAPFTDNPSQPCEEYKAKP